MSVSVKDDSELGIVWPMPGQVLLLSVKYLDGVLLNEAEVYP